MTRLRLLLGDQLTRSITALDGLDPARDVILLAEVAQETTYVPHHRQKLVLVLSAMRHFAADLIAEGLRVDYIRLDDPANTGDITGELSRAIARHQPSSIICTAPGEWRVWQMMRDWQARFSLPVEIRDDTRFFAAVRDFRDWAKGRKSLRMEFFYRDLRRRTGLLMQPDGQPAGGRWNFDSENRKSLPAGHQPPPRRRFPPDAVTQEVIGLIARRFPDGFGDLDGFGWPVTRREALEALTDFITHALPTFGDYQDAMARQHPFLYHALLAPALNIGLLTAAEVCAAAEAAWQAGRVPLNAAEGFIRQILGWREYVRGLYWTQMPAYAGSNALNARRPLPAFYWTGDTPLNCLSVTVRDIRRHAYAHHIQRLMITGNFALLAGLDPAAVEDWYLAVFADAFEWVELPNTHGMALFADGGLMASKPYAASGAYISRMSDYCGSCRFDPAQKTGPRACPFNALYWDFLARNRDVLAGNPRLSMPYSTLGRMAPQALSALRADAAAFLETLA
jgi:deoxyribodipyrimidine photolyase-related protein